MARATTRGLEPGAPIRVTNACSKKHSRGWFQRMLTAELVEYRSQHNGGCYQAPLSNVRVDREQKKRAAAFRAVTRSPRRKVRK